MATKSNDGEKYTGYQACPLPRGGKYLHRAQKVDRRKQSQNLGSLTPYPPLKNDPSYTWENI